jgi:IS30 family transposase
MGRKQIYGDELNPEMKRLFEEGCSLREIGRRLAVHHEIVRRRLVNLGVKTRNRTEAMVQFHRRKNEQNKQEAK